MLFILKLFHLYFIGGFSVVFKVRDITSGRIYALKRLIGADAEASEEIQREMDTIQVLQPHPHIMKFVTCDVINGNTYMLLT